MAWVRIDDNVPHHRKMLKAGPDACWLWLCGIAYCQRQLSDGFIPECALTTLGVGTDLRRNEHPSALVRRLIRVGLFEKVPGGFQVHDYHDHNETRANTLERKRLLSETRSVSGKAGAKSRWQGDGKPIATPDGKPMAPSHPIPSSTKNPPTPLSRGGNADRITRKALKHAEETRRGIGGCPHSPPCEQYQGCLRRIAVTVART